MYGLECRGACGEAVCTFLHKIWKLWQLQEAAVTTVPMLPNLQESSETQFANFSEGMLRFWILERAAREYVCMLHPVYKVLMYKVLPSSPA